MASSASGKGPGAGKQQTAKADSRIERDREMILAARANGGWATF
jgi:hypothetical protein